MEVLLVDDDYYVVKALEEKIDWPSLGITAVHTAYNVAQAKEILLLHRIEILICDIEMPQGSGLELLAWIRGEHGNVQAIILTNYADFNYAQKAIELQSFDYFLKPIEFDKLSLIIRKAVAKALEQRISETARVEGDLWNKHRKSVVQHFWHRLIAGKVFPSSPSAHEAFVTEQNLPYAPEDLFTPLLFDLFPSERSLGEHDKSLFDYSLLNVLYETLQDDGFVVEAIAEIRGYRWMAVLKWNRSPDTGIAECACASFIARANTYLRSDACCIVGIPAPLAGIQETVKDLLQMNDEIVKDRNRIFVQEGYIRREAEYVPPDLDAWERLLEEREYGRFLEETKRYLRALQDQTTTTAALSQFRLDISQLVYTHLKSREIQAHRLYAGRVTDRLSDMALGSIEDMQNYVQHLAETAAAHRRFADQPQSVIGQITQHIRSHCGEELTRTSLAELVYLNPDYLARLFKKETGISLGAYIIQTRLEQAKQLLATTRLSFYAVAVRVGYSNYSHFSKLFKQDTGCTPNEYRKRRLEGAPVK